MLFWTDSWRNMRWLGMSFCQAFRSIHIGTTDLGSIGFVFLHFLFEIFVKMYIEPLQQPSSALCVIYVCHLILFWCNVVIPSGRLYQIWKKHWLAWQGYVHLDSQNALMTLIVQFASSYFMNPLQPLVDIRFASHVYFSQWIVVGTSWCWFVWSGSPYYFRFKVQYFQWTIVWGASITNNYWIMRVQQ